MNVGKIDLHASLTVKTLHNPGGALGTYTLKTPVTLTPGVYLIEWDGENDPTFISLGVPNEPS